MSRRRCSTPRSAICSDRFRRPTGPSTRSSGEREESGRAGRGHRDRGAAPAARGLARWRGRRSTSSKRARAGCRAHEHGHRPDQSLADFLASVEMLSPFTRAELERLAEHAESRFFSFGETVCNAGEPADGLFVIKSGSVRIFTEEHGKEISMGVRKERDVFAEIAMLREYAARIVGARIGEDRAALHTAQGHRCRSLPAMRRRRPSSPATSRSAPRADSSPGCSICAARSTRASSRNSSAASA